jgi:hypothetical protein
MTTAELGAVLDSLLGQSREQVDVNALALVCGERTVLQALALVDAHEGPSGSSSSMIRTHEQLIVFSTSPRSLDIVGTHSLHGLSHVRLPGRPILIIPAASLEDFRSSPALPRTWALVLPLSCIRRQSVLFWSCGAVQARPRPHDRQGTRPCPTLPHRSNQPRSRSQRRDVSCRLAHLHLRRHSTPLPLSPFIETHVYRATSPLFFSSTGTPASR